MTGNARRTVDECTCWHDCCIDTHMLEIQEAMVTVKPCQRVVSLEWTDDETQM
jgi:hypothetical protein